MLKKTLNTYEQQCLIPALKDCNVWANLLENSCWQPAVRGSQTDMSCLLLSLHGFVSWVCWQPPLGAQTFKSVFCHGLSSFCYTRVTTTLLFPLRSSPCWLRASSFLSCCPLSFIQSLPSPPRFLTEGSYLLEMPALTQPKSWVLPLLAVLSCMAAFTHSMPLRQGASGWAGGSWLGGYRGYEPVCVQHPMYSLGDLCGLPA